MGREGWGVIPEHGGHLSAWKQLVPGLSQNPLQPHPDMLSCRLARTLLGTLSPMTERLDLCGPVRDRAAPGRAPALGVCPSLWSSYPSLVPEERGSQLRAPGCFQRRPANGEHWSNTGKLGRGLLGMSPPRPLGGTRGRSQSSVQPMFVGHMQWARQF